MVPREGSSYGRNHHRKHHLEGFQHHIEGRAIKALLHTYDKTSLSQGSQFDILGNSLLLPHEFIKKDLRENKGIMLRLPIEQPSPIRREVGTFLDLSS